MQRYYLHAPCRQSCQRCSDGGVLSRWQHEASPRHRHSNEHYATLGVATPPSRRTNAVASRLDIDQTSLGLVDSLLLFQGLKQELDTILLELEILELP